jgi:hypothetical protein
MQRGTGNGSITGVLDNSAAGLKERGNEYHTDFL